MGRPISIRSSLLRTLTVAIVLLGGGLFATTFLAAERSAALLSSYAMDRTIDAVEAELRGFFDPVQQQLDIARGSNVCSGRKATNPTNSRISASG